MAKSTITAIAQRVGVSAATVSRALNDQPGVGADKRREILALAAELDYYPNVIARNLQSQRTNTVAYLAEVDDRDAADLFFFKDFITALAERCAHHNLDLLIHPVASGASSMRDIARVLRSGRADGLIMADVRRDDPRVSRLSEQQLPFVTFGRHDIATDAPFVDVDGASGTRLAMQHVIAHGHRRIAFLGLPASYTCAGDRYAGYQQALAAHGLPVRADYSAECGSTETATRAVVERMLSLPKPPTAFVAASDMLAVYAMAAAAARGMLAGRDYAITGFDDLPLAQHTHPPLTTLRQPLHTVCDALIRCLMQTVDQHTTESVLVQPELVIRDSS